MSLSDQIKDLIRTGKKDGYILEKNLNKCISSFSETDQNYIKNKLNSYDSLVTAKNKIKKETAYKFKNIMPDLHKDFTKNN